MPLLEIVRIAVALLGTGAAAYQDAKTSFIDEKITYSMIAAGALLNIASLNFSSFPNSIDWNFLLNSFGVAAVIFTLGYVLYRKGQLGGGDVLLFTGLHLLLPMRPVDFGLPLLSMAAPQLSIAQALAYQRALSAILPILSIFASASFFALIGSAFFYAKALFGKKLEPNALVAGIMGVASVVFAAFIYNLTGDFAQAFFFLTLSLSATFLAAFKKQILEQVIVQRLAIDDFEEEDILVTGMMDEKIVQKYEIGKVLTQEEVKKLRQVQQNEGVKLFPVAKILPRLGPYVLLGLLCTLLLGDLFAFFLVL